MSQPLVPQPTLARQRVAKPLTLLAASLLAPLVASPLVAQSDARTVLEAPGALQRAADHGRAKAEETSSVTVHLKLHDEDAYNQALAELYHPGSPTFHKWMTPSDLARYAATPEEMATVRKEMESHGLTILDADAESSSIHARGNVTQLEAAFQTEIHEYEYAGKTFRANARPASMPGAAGTLIKGVTGLTNMPFKSHAVSFKEPHSGKTLAPIKVPAGTNPVLSTLFTSNCFTGAGEVQFQSVPASPGAPALPAASYYGPVYNAVNLPCGYTPQEVQAHYGLKAAYKAGYEGEGQTIVIVDGPSYAATVASDFALFNKWTGLPNPASYNFHIVYPDGAPSPIELEYITDWTTEADLDVQWAHAMAPKARIVLLITPTQDWTEFEYAIQYAVKNHLGNVISNSYGYPEFLYGKSTVEGFEQVLKAAAAAGVTVNFSSGDSGDEGTGNPHAGGASYPATSAYATAVGGTTLNLLNPGGTYADTGWGVNESFLSFGWTYPLDPPYVAGFVYGAGGGESTYIPKPAWQSSVPGTGRQEPDIAAIADPGTGGIFVYYGSLSAIGGTSLASPVFSGIWALALEKAGAPLGQAAPLFASLPAGAIKDVLPVTSPQDVAGYVVDTKGSTYYSAATLSSPLQNTTSFYSALFDETNDHEGDYDALAFGTDSSLTITQGWDNVTGYGQPNGYTFITDVAATVAANTP
ncbi:MAG TPA: S53 family peptidase, partial [Acidobacteriaceae bacterium]